MKHFQSKDELALEAFDYAFNLLNNRIWSVVKTKRNAIERLEALVSSYLIYIEDPLN